MSSIQELIEKNVPLTVLGLLFVGFLAGASTVVFLDSRSPPTVPMTDYDELVKRISELESVECPRTFKSEFDKLKEEFRELESKQCPPSYQSEYEALSKQLEDAQQRSDRMQEASRNYISSLEDRNNRLQEKNDALIAEQMPKVTNIADIDSIFVIHGKYEHSKTKKKHTWQSEISWREIFSIISPYLGEKPHDDTVKRLIIRNLIRREDLPGYFHKLEDQDFRTIALQLEGYGLVEVYRSRTANDSVALFWRLTPKGEQMLLDIRIVK